MLIFHNVPILQFIHRTCTSLCATVCVHTFPFSFITTGTRFVCEVHIIAKLSQPSAHSMFCSWICHHYHQSHQYDEERIRRWRLLKNWWRNLSEDIHLEDVDEDGKMKVMLEVKVTDLECFNWAEMTKYRV